jgi:hypothetical protein
MATKISVALDDLDGDPVDEKMEFGFGDAQCEIDLNRKNAGLLGRGGCGCLARRDG